MAVASFFYPISHSGFPYSCDGVCLNDEGAFFRLSADFSDSRFDITCPSNCVDLDHDDRLPSFISDCCVAPENETSPEAYNRISNLLSDHHLIGSYTPPDGADWPPSTNVQHSIYLLAKFACVPMIYTYGDSDSVRSSDSDPDPDADC